MAVPMLIRLVCTAAAAKTISGSGAMPARVLHIAGTPRSSASRIAVRVSCGVARLMTRLAGTESMAHLILSLHGIAGHARQGRQHAAGALAISIARGPVRRRR